jgi:hypothetical protein
MSLLKRLLTHYHIDIVLAIIFSIVAFIYVYDNSALLSAIARKIALASIGLVYYYTTRFTKIGHIEWSEPYDKIYSLALLFYVAVIFSFG